jgi:hypothetical protein
MDEAVAVYQHRAEQCLALALGAQDEAQRQQSIEMAMYWFRLVESTNGGKAPEALLVRLDRNVTRPRQPNPAESLWRPAPDGVHVAGKEVSREQPNSRSGTGDRATRSSRH